jgi:hypothetical protein
MTRYISLASRAHVPTTAGMSSEPIPEHEKLGKLRSPQLPSGHIAAAGQSKHRMPSSPVRFTVMYMFKTHSQS